MKGPRHFAFAFAFAAPALQAQEAPAPPPRGSTMFTERATRKAAFRNEPALAAVPVIFCTARSGLLDRMAGLTLGADDYITKPFAPSELLMRI